MAEPNVIDVEVNEQQQSKKIRKRKRGSSTVTVSPSLTSDEKASRIHALNEEMDKLFEYYREIMSVKMNFNASECSTMNSMVAILLEESDLSLSNLVDYVLAELKLVHERLKEKESGPLTLGLVKSAILFVGQRVMYGVPNLEADVLEDNTPSSLWCWETRDAKLMPKSVRGILKTRRICRKKIHERITAVSAMIQALQKPEDDPAYSSDLVKLSDKLGKVLNEADIRLLVNSMLQKNSTEMAAKEAKREEKLLIKQLEKRKLEVEKEKNKIELELQKEKQQTEKRQKRLLEAAEKEEKRREKEELEMQRQLKKQQEEAEKEQRRREKVEAELKKQLSIQKQASLMQRFLKRGKTNQPGNNDGISTTVSTSASLKVFDMVPEAVTSLMDFALSSNDDIPINDIRKSHLLSWKQLGCSVRSKGPQHWNARQKPKTEMFKELKLVPTKELAPEGLSPEKLVCHWKGQNSDDGPGLSNLGSSQSVAKNHMRKQLLQFTKSYRPAFYGLWPKRSNVVGPRRPFKKDPDLDYDVDSDEEWEEEEPGESLSDCDKDDEEESVEIGCSKADEDEESEDGFFVPDGYLSENEGVQVDKNQTGNSVEEDRSSPGNSQDPEIEDFYALLQLQKYLNNLTEVALKKNQPLIIANLIHEGDLPSIIGDSGFLSKHESTCLQALSIRSFPSAPPIETSETDMEYQDEVVCLSSNKAITTPMLPVTAIRDSDIPIFVSTIRSCSQSINKVVESLQQKFPTVSKSQLRTKVREISDYVDNHWQVKKEILGEVGMSISPDKKVARTQKISSFFSKRCLPPTGKRLS